MTREQFALQRTEFLAQSIQQIASDMISNPNDSDAINHIMAVEALAGLVAWTAKRYGEDQTSDEGLLIGHSLVSDYHPPSRNGVLEVAS